MQRFPEVIADMNALESEFLEYETTPCDEVPAYFDENDNPKYILITFGTNCLNKLIYTLVKLV